MAFDPKYLITTGGQAKSGIGQTWFYISKTDSRDVVSADGYFNSYRESFFKGNYILVLDTTTANSSKYSLMIVAKPLQGDVTTEIVDSETSDIIREITHEPTGFTSPEDIVVTGDSTTRKVTLTGTVNAYNKGVLNAELVSGYVSPAHNNDTNPYFLICDGTTIQWVTPANIDFTCVLIAFTFYAVGSNERVYANECHGLMQWQVHKENHYVLGTYKESGGVLADYVLESNTAADRRPSVSSSVIVDEDLPVTNPLLAANGPYTIFTLTSTGLSDFDDTPVDIVPLSTNRPYYNEFTGGNWTQTLMTNNYYMSIWLAAIPMASDADSQKYRYIWIQGQTQHATLTGEQGLNPNSLSLGDLQALLPEFVFIGRVIIRYQGANWEFMEVLAIDGTRFSQSSSPQGNYLSTVTSDATLTGDGTVATPLGIDLTNANTWTGKQTFQDQVFIESETYPVARFTRSTSETSTAFGIADFVHKTDGDAADGFGCVFNFLITDSGVSNSKLGVIECIRNGADDTGSIRIAPNNAGSLVRTMTIIPNAVGIGVSSPQSVLHIQSSGPVLRLENSTNEDILNGRESRLRFVGRQSGNEITSLAEIVASHNSAADDQLGSLDFKINTGAGVVSAMYIDSAGQVGIGRTPTAMLDVYKASGAVSMIIESDDNDVTIFLDGVKTSNSDVGSFIFNNAGDSIGALRCNRVGANDAGEFLIATQATGGSLENKFWFGATGKQGIGSNALSNECDLLLNKDGVLAMKETTTPAADADYGKIYWKNDNKCYGQDGAGTEHEFAFVP